MATGYTVEQDFYTGRLRDDHGLTGLIPDAPDRCLVHDVIYDERRGGDALARLAQGEWLAASVVTRLFGTWSAARAKGTQGRRRLPAALGDYPSTTRR